MSTTDRPRPAGQPQGHATATATRNIVRMRAARGNRGPVVSGGTAPLGIAAPGSTIIACDITLSPLSRELIGRHVDARGRCGVWPSRVTVVAQGVGPVSCAGPAVRAHVTIDGPGLQLPVVRQSGEGPVAHDLRIAIRCGFMAVEAELVRRAGLHPR